MSTRNERIPPRPYPRSPSRFGPTAIIREVSPPEDAHLICLFKQKAEAAVAERRQSPRFRAAGQRAWLGWWTCPGGFNPRATHLDNISQGGAKLVMVAPPPAGQIVWLCVGVPDPTECVQAKVLEVTLTPEGDSVIRIAFGTPCPQNLYQMAIHGLAERRSEGD
jgi:hypothetical protein